MRKVAVTAAVVAVALAGCIRPGVLVAESGEHRMVARDRDTGITVILTTNAWDGAPADLERELTVVHALVANMGTNPVLLAPGDIDFFDVRGFRYELLDAGGTFHRSEQPADEGRYIQRNTRGYDRGLHDDYGYVRSTHGDVAQAALPWGVLEPGTQMRGFLYFEKVTDTAHEAKLVWHLRTPDHRALVDLSFHFFVARPR